jgi:hypothetical protein
MIVPGSLGDWLQAALMTTLLGVGAARLGWVLLDGERLEPVPSVTRRRPTHAVPAPVDRMGRQGSRARRRPRWERC